MNYIPRIIDDELKNKLNVTGAVLVRGPKWCGKTTSAKQIAKSVLEMQNPDLQENYLELANLKPSLLLEGDKPRLIDEWQLAPRLWNAVRYDVDRTGLTKQYILTGSSVPVEDDTLHSGVGRFSFVTMKPMTLYESGDSNGKISLKELLDGKRGIDGIKTDLNYEKIAYVLCRGGWPNTLELSSSDALLVAKNYIDALINSDISRVDGVKRNANLALLILRAYARSISTINSDKSLFLDVRANNQEVSDKTIGDYLGVLKKLYIIEDIPAWSPNIRSKTSIRTSAKKSFIDPSLAVAALGITPEELIMDPKTYGLLFENLVNRDLSVYSKAIGGSLSHYRDRFGLECDNVIHFDNGKYVLVEIKLGGDKILEAESHLLKLEKLIDANEYLHQPEFMMIITGTEMAYTLPSGVLVVPIGCLRN